MAMAKDGRDKTTGDIFSRDSSILTLGAALAARRQIHNKVCLICGEKFKAIATAKYCSNRCRQQAKRMRAAVA